MVLTDSQAYQNAQTARSSAAATPAPGCRKTKLPQPQGCIARMTPLKNIGCSSDPGHPCTRRRQNLPLLRSPGRSARGSQTMSDPSWSNGTIIAGGFSRLCKYPLQLLDVPSLPSRFFHRRLCMKCGRVSSWKLSYLSYYFSFFHILL